MSPGILQHHRCCSVSHLKTPNIAPQRVSECIGTPLRAQKKSDRSTTGSRQKKNPWGSMDSVRENLMQEQAGAPSIARFLNWIGDRSFGGIPADQKNDLSTWYRGFVQWADSATGRNVHAARYGEARKPEWKLSGVGSRITCNKCCQLPPLT